MVSKAMVVHCHQMNLGYANLLLRDIDDARMADQPHPGMTHPAWIVGHLAWTTDVLGGFLDAPPQCPQTWESCFGRGSQLQTDRAAYPDKTTLLETYTRSHAEMATAFLQATEAQLDNEIPLERLRKRFSCIGEVAVFALTAHPSIHLGQLSAWRRAMGMGHVM